MNVADIANEIYQELGEPTGLLTSSIIYWLSTNIGALNILLETSFTINSNDNSVAVPSGQPAMGDDEKTILKALYEAYYFQRLLNSTLALASSGNGAIVQVQEGDKTVRLVSQTEIAKSYQSVVAGIKANLNILVQSYRVSRTTPLEVVYELRNCWRYNPTPLNHVPY